MESYFQLGADVSLAELQHRLNDAQETKGLRLLEVSHGLIKSKPSNVATFEAHGTDAPVHPLSVIEVPGTPADESFVNRILQQNGVELICYTDVYINSALKPVLVVSEQGDLQKIKSSSSMLSVALVDIDSKISCIKQLVDAANTAQHYYYFLRKYIQVPAGVVRKDIDQGRAVPQMFLTRLQPYLLDQPDKLGTDLMCCFTRHPIAFERNRLLNWNYFSSSLPGNRVSVISSYGIPEYAKKAGVSFAKAMLYQCLSMIAATQPGSDLTFHTETAGCLFDFNGDRDDIVVALKKMRFDHLACRNKVKDPHQLEAIDAILALRI